MALDCELNDIMELVGNEENKAWRNLG
jgi:DNA-binding Xre family transcriptional regulator